MTNLALQPKQLMSHREQFMAADFVSSTNDYLPLCNHLDLYVGMNTTSYQREMRVFIFTT